MLTAFAAGVSSPAKQLCDSGTAGFAWGAMAVTSALAGLFGLGERVAPPTRMGEAMALLGSGLIAGQGIAALMAGRLAENSGYGATVALSCASGLAAVLVALTLVRQKACAAPAEPLPTAWAGASAATAGSASSEGSGPYGWCSSEDLSTRGADPTIPEMRTHHEEGM
ncbi:hypothetical protein ACWCXB_15695 [Streptomyces sp. NPDC001514]